MPSCLPRCLNQDRGRMKERLITMLIVILTLRRPPRLLRGRGYGRHVGSVGACLQQKARGRGRKAASRLPEGCLGASRVVQARPAAGSHVTVWRGACVCVWVYNGNQGRRLGVGSTVKQRRSAVAMQSFVPEYRWESSFVWRWVDCRQLWARWRGRKVGGGGGGWRGGPKNSKK